MKKIGERFSLLVSNKSSRAPSNDKSRTASHCDYLAISLSDASIDVDKIHNQAGFSLTSGSINFHLYSSHSTRPNDQLSCLSLPIVINYNVKNGRKISRLNEKNKKTLNRPMTETAIEE